MANDRLLVTETRTYAEGEDYLTYNGFRKTADADGGPIAYRPIIRDDLIPIPIGLVRELIEARHDLDRDMAVGSIETWVEELTVRDANMYSRFHAQKEAADGE